MGKLISAIAKDGSVVCYAIDSTDIVARAERIHRTSATVTAALGRLLTAASLMGSRLKEDNASLTLRMDGGGPTGTVLAVSDSSGNVRGYSQSSIVEIPLNKHGKLDVAGAVGNTGNLYVMRDLGYGEPYISQVPIVSGEIAEDITSYFAVSEQIPTVCALGVLVNPELTVQAAGGFLVQLLPGAPDETIDRLEKTIQDIRPISEMLSEGMTPEQIAEVVLDGFEPNVVGEFEVGYRCDCSRDRTDGALRSLGKDELVAMADEQPVTEVDCHFCNKIYRYSPDELRAFAAEFDK